MNGAAVDFSLTRFEAVDGARLEVEGTWTGVRGVRFVRPALVVRGEAGAEKTLLADLEHKPWPAQEGETWVAAFPWKGGEPDVARTQLAVAPSIVVPLGGAAAAGGAATVDPFDALQARVDAAEERARRLEAEVAFLRREREERKERAAGVSRAEVEALRRERDEAVAERDRLAAAAQQKPTSHDREAIRAELRQRDAALAARDEAVAARDAAFAERDEARRALADAEARVTERERRQATTRLEQMEGALAAAEAERDRALDEPAGVAAPPVRTPRQHASQSARADWAARTAAILAVFALLILAMTFLKALT
jgi:hypothetical protein